MGSRRAKAGLKLYLVWSSALLILLFGFLILLFTGLEALFCILVAAPLVFVAVTLGLFLGWWAYGLARLQEL